MRVRPLHDGLIIKPDPLKRQIGLIHLPDTKDPRVMTGVVQCVGKGRRYADGVYLSTEVKEGDRVVFLTAVKEAGVFRDIARKFDDGQFLIGERDVLFVVEGDEIPEVE